MKNLFASLSMAVLFSGVVMAQGIYLRAGSGYGLPIAASSIGEKYLRTQIYDGNNTTTTNSVEGVNGSYGSGVNFNFAFGYKFNENFIFDISSQYLVSNKYRTYNKDIYTSTADPQFPFTGVDNYITTSSAKGLFLNPSLIFSAGFGKAAPYGRFGFVFGSPKVIMKGSYYYNGDGIDSTATSWEYSKGISFGFQGAIGMNWKLTEKMDLYTELNFLSLTYYAGEYNLTKSISSDGFTITDNLPGMSLSQKQTIYKKKYDPSAAYNQSEPSVGLREGRPFSSLSVQVGIRFDLWNKSE